MTPHFSNPTTITLRPSVPLSLPQRTSRRRCCPEGVSKDPRSNGPFISLLKYSTRPREYVVIGGTRKRTEGVRLAQPCPRREGGNYGAGGGGGGGGGGLPSHPSHTDKATQHRQRERERERERRWQHFGGGCDDVVRAT